VAASGRSGQEMCNSVAMPELNIIHNCISRTGLMTPRRGEIVPLRSIPPAQRRGKLTPSPSLESTEENHISIVSEKFRIVLTS
jgi:hypothetical protein